MNRAHAILALTALLLGSCASVGTQVDPNKVAAFQKGVTKYADVVQALGAPNAQTTASDGTMIAVYVHTQVSARAQDFIPLIGPLVSKADANSDSYTFTFDEAGLLESVSSSNTQVTAGSGLVN